MKNFNLALCAIYCPKHYKKENFKTFELLETVSLWEESITESGALDW